MTLERVLITADIPEPHLTEVYRQLEKAGLSAIYRPAHPGWEASDLAAMVPGVSAILAGGDLIDEQVLQSADRLRIISRVGVGFDRIDIESAMSRGVTVTITPGASTDTVADFAVALLLATVRDLVGFNESMHAGKWKPAVGRDLRELTLGIIGYGRIGQAVAKRMLAFDMTVIAHDPVIGPEDDSRPSAVRWVSLDELLRQSQVVTLHVPLTSQTRHLIDAAALSRVQHGSYLVNTSRGGLLDEAALLDALDVGTLAAAGLDCLDSEPPTGLSARLARHPRVVSSPHVAGGTHAAVGRSTRDAVASVIELLSGRIPGGRVTLETAPGQPPSNAVASDGDSSNDLHGAT